MYTTSSLVQNDKLIVTSSKNQKINIEVLGYNVEDKDVSLKVDDTIITISKLYRYQPNNLVTLVIKPVAVTNSGIYLYLQEYF